jgi:hypothetical protein
MACGPGRIFVPAFCHCAASIGPHSLGFGPSSSGAPGVHKEGNIFDLNLLGQYAANFSISDGLGSPLITDPPAPSSATQTPLVAYHQGLIIAPAGGTRSEPWRPHGLDRRSLLRFKPLSQRGK